MPPARSPSAAAGSPRGRDQREAAADHVVEAARHAGVSHQVLHEELAGRGRAFAKQPGPSGGSGASTAPALARPRDHAPVARGGLGRVGHADHAPELHREVDHRATCGVRSVCSCRAAPRSPAREHQVELPGQVRGVAQAGAHALAGEGRRLVRGVAREQRAPVPPAVGPARAEGVDRVALELRVARVHAPRPEQPPCRLLACSARRASRAGAA